MRFLNWNVLQLLFRVVCFVTAAFMIGYWIYKFEKDEDVSVIAYKSLEKTEDALYPAFSICFLDPFLNKRLKEIGKDINSTTYKEYLKGNRFDETYKYIDFNNVTLDLSKYLVILQMVWKTGYENVNNTCKNLYNCPLVDHRITFTGFVNGRFVKCFGVEVKNSYMKHVQAIMTVFKASLGNLLRHIGKVRVKFSYPQQILPDTKSEQLIWHDLNKITNIQIFRIKTVEILKRRNKRKERCFEDWRNFDELVLKRHIENVGCRAPYHGPYKQFPVCDTQRKIKESVYEVGKVRSKYFPPPCNEISKIDYSFISEQPDSKMKFVWLFVEYTDQLKLITQSQAIDVHSLIGNIGGYIGLFLGYAIIQLPDFLMFIYDRIKKMKFFRNIPIPNVITVMEQNEGERAPGIDAEQQTDPNQDQISSEGRDILNVLSRVEEKQGERLEENDRRLSKLEENEINHFKQRDDMTTTIDTIIDLKNRKIRQDISDYQQQILAVLGDMSNMQRDISDVKKRLSFIYGKNVKHRRRKSSSN